MFLSRSTRPPHCLRIVVLALLLVASGSLAACQRENQSDPRTLPDPATELGSSAGDGTDQSATPVTVYLVSLDPSANLLGTTIGCGDRLVAVNVPARSNTLSNALVTLLGQRDTLGLVNTLRQGGRLTLDSVITDDGRAHIYVSGPLEIRGVCDHPRIAEQLRATARYAGTDSLAFYVNGMLLDSMLSLQ